MEKRLGIIMHGVTGRMGMNQHLIRSILEIRKQGGVTLKDGTRLVPDPLLVGRNAAKVEELARQHGVHRWTADLDAALKGPDQIFFDAASRRRISASARTSRIRVSASVEAMAACSLSDATSASETSSMFKSPRETWNRSRLRK